MREIKFRILKDGRWYYATLGELTKNVGFDYSVPKNVMAFIDGKYRTQFTGLKDKNGKETYFGDICKYEDDSGAVRVGVVKDYGYFSGYIEAIGGDDEGNQDLELHPDCEYEIIGNKFENPELLERKDKT